MSRPDSRKRLTPPPPHRPAPCRPGGRQKRQCANQTPLDVQGSRCKREPTHQVERREPGLGMHQLHHFAPAQERIGHEGTVVRRHAVEALNRVIPATHPSRRGRGSGRCQPLYPQTRLNQRIVCSTAIHLRGRIDTRHKEHARASLRVSARVRAEPSCRSLAQSNGAGAWQSRRVGGV